MKIEFSGQKLENYKIYSNVYVDSALRQKGEIPDNYIGFIEKSLKKHNHRALDDTRAYVFVNDKGIVRLFTIEGMRNYRKISKAFNATDIEFIHNYLLSNTGTGQAAFMPNSFNEIKKNIPIETNKVSYFFPSRIAD